MRVLLVQSFLGRQGLADLLVFPLGLACVATALEAAGHAPRILDLNACADDPWPVLAEEIRAFRPDAIGVSLRNIDSTTRKAPFVYHTFLRPTLEVIRREAPGVPAILGGPGFTQAARTFMERYPFDYGVQAEAEETFPRLLAALPDAGSVPGVYQRTADGVRYAGDPIMPDFAGLPFPRRHHVDWERYRLLRRDQGLLLDVGIETTRGCPRRCAYCNYPFLNGRRLRMKPPEAVGEEIAYLVRDFDVHQFTFTDSRFNENGAHARAICEEILRRGLKVRWIAWLGFKDLDAGLLRLMRRAGCFRVAFSPDGLLQPSLDRMQKDTTTEEILASVRAVRQTPGLKASWSFFCTPPGTSAREQAALLAAYAWIHGSLAGRGRMVLTWCRVEEGTRFAEIAREDGFLRGDEDLLPEDPARLDALFYVPPGLERASAFWDRFLQAEMDARAAVGTATRPLRRFGFRDLTPPHLRGDDRKR